MSLHSRRGERGFTLIETMVAISVFSIMTVGIAPLLLSSLRGSSLARSYTVGKNLAQEAMERVRGFPYYDTAPRRDVVDLYFPNVSTGYDAGTKSFVTSCTSTTSTPAASGALACPPDHSDGTTTIPAGYTVTFIAEFVRPTDSSPEAYTVVTPPTTYDSNVAANSIPPAPLMRMAIRVDWIQQGASKQFQLTSLIGDRKLSPERARAAGTVDFLIQALATYTESSGRQSSLRANIGRSSSSIAIRNFASADVDSNAGRFTLTRDEFGTEPGAGLADVSGAQAIYRAPPDRNPIPVTATTVPTTVTHPDLGEQVAFLTTSAVNESTIAPVVGVPNQLPVARSGFSVTSGSNEETFWLANQADPGVLGLGGLFNSQRNRILSTRREPGGARLAAQTLAQATSAELSSTRKVEAQVTAAFSRLMIMPASFITAGGGVVEIRDFTATFSCLARGSAGAPTATGSWSATLKFWRSTGCNLIGCSGTYQEIPLAGNTASGLGRRGAADLAFWQQPANNPVVKDSLNPSDRVYLFDDPALGRPGFLSSWSATEVINSETAPESANAAMDSAISIVTGQTNPANSQTKVAVTVGKLSCAAVDNRG